MKVYTDPRVFDLARAVGKLPISPTESPDVQAASGTTGEAGCMNPQRWAQRKAQ